MLISLYGLGFLIIYGVVFTSMAMGWRDRVVTICILVSFFWVILGFGLVTYSHKNESLSSCTKELSISKHC